MYLPDNEQYRFHGLTLIRKNIPHPVPRSYLQVTITKDQAQKILDEQGVNRSKGKATIDAYMRSMNNGDWMPNHPQPIAFDSATGLLTNGQHRLTAFTLSNLDKIDFRVDFTDSVNEVSVLDVIRPRTVADFFRISGRSNVKTLSGTAKCFRHWLEGDSGSKAIAPRVISDKTDKILSPENERLLNAHPELIGSVEYVVSKSKTVQTLIASQCMLAVLVYLLRKTTYGPTMANSFMDQLLSGANLAPNSPIYVARKQLTENPTGAGKRSVHATAVLIWAWNDWVAGKTRVRGYTQQGSNYTYPMIAGKPLGVSDLINGP